MTVIDASALLAFLKSELGQDVVEEALDAEVRVSAANWSEVAQKIAAANGDWNMVSTVLKSYGLRVEPVTETDAEVAAEIWEPGRGLSLADRLCIALGTRFDDTVMTADRAWGSGRRIRQIR
ncbi:type II toxin-antitoxin system VapC family toxin [Garicola koreensis]|uniref:PIN domain nuclease of toxin-antitoxin system n=1 Tax=Garicola koreensis TaxID=1262554 RepID=A0A7W5XKU5_9MICC|nr:type II toxin-antitoxin system VapC family toxin [Garicola koreensis]MBB3667325.1 PIN domain nuclease of toxin-antitoxin system [Garicola koreensis]